MSYNFGLERKETLETQEMCEKLKELMLAATSDER